MELNTVKGRTHWKPFTPSIGSPLLYSFQHRRKAVLCDLSQNLIGSSFDFGGLLLAATPLDRSERSASPHLILSQGCVFSAGLPRISSALIGRIEIARVPRV